MADSQRFTGAAERLKDSVIRPIGAASTKMPSDPTARSITTAELGVDGVGLPAPPGRDSASELELDAWHQTTLSAKDRQSMAFAFDLWSHQDVARHAAGILARLEAGTMRCDGAWPAERVETFRRWTQSGTPE